MSLEGADEEEIENRKILTKRRRRVGKIEDIPLDLEAIFARNKRFRPDESTSETLD